MNKLTEQVFGLMPWGQFTSQDVATLFPEREDRVISADLKKN